MALISLEVFFLEKDSTRALKPFLLRMIDVRAVQRMIGYYGHHGWNVSKSAASQLVCGCALFVPECQWCPKESVRRDM